MKLIVVISFLLVLVSSSFVGSANWRPVVVMHGIFHEASIMDTMISWIEDDYPGIYVHNAEVGDGLLDSVFMDMNSQVELFAASIQSDPNLKDGFNMVCWSQGALICRGYIERYNDPPVHNYVSWAGPQQGVYGAPDFKGLCPPSICPYVDDLFDLLINGSWTETSFQEGFSFAGYWKDPFNYQAYLDVNIFLADINNERATKNMTYRQNMLSLNSLLLLDSSIDDVVIPWQSPAFWFYEMDSDQELVPFNESGTYIGDWIGLRTLDQQNKIQFVTVPCSHHNLPAPQCKRYYDMYTKAYLNNMIASFM